ncbi:MAG: glycosyltransferase involved in cell wall biosynthesis [Cyclobacteriaceae bacterium]|jgi:glycosyltransferase involved in cell wall biosynthesis
MRYILEPNGKTNTAKYVSNIIVAEKIFTSRKNIYDDENEVVVFGNYGVSKGLKKLVYYLVGWFKIVSTVKINDIFHYHWLKLSFMDFFFLRILKSRGIIIVGTVHNILPHETKFFDFYFFRKIYGISDSLIFHTKGIYQSYCKSFPAPLSYHIIDHYFDKVKIEKKLENPHHILFFGNIRPYKGLEILIESLDKISYDGEWEVTIAGQVEYDIDLLIESQNKRANIHWLINYIPDNEVELLFNKAGVVVMPYLKIDTSGLLYLAKSYGKLIIAPKLGIFEENIDNGENGILFEVGNAVDLAKAINKAFDSDLFKRIKSRINKDMPVNSIAIFKEKHQKVYSLI